MPRRNVVLLGAGGAGAAVAYAALQLGVARLAIYDIENERSQQLAERYSHHYGTKRIAAVTNLSAAFAEADGVIQATPIGMLGHPGLPVSAELLRPELWVAEVIYFPLETEFLKQARRLGCRVLDGGGMAVFQAVEAFRLFTGITPDHERMWQHFARMGKLFDDSR